VKLTTTPINWRWPIWRAPATDLPQNLLPGN
jgi:hypothetical protein